MNITEAPRVITSRITWAVARSMTSAEFDAYATSAVDVNARPGTVLARGTVTLGNGGKRKAERFVGSMDGRVFVRYQAPNGGRWHLADATGAETTFIAN